MDLTADWTQQTGRGLKVRLTENIQLKHREGKKWEKEQNGRDVEYGPKSKTSK